MINLIKMMTTLPTPKPVRMNAGLVKTDLTRMITMTMITMTMITMIMMI